MTNVSVDFRSPCWCPSRWAPTWRPIQISISLDDTILRIARELKTAETWFLARLFILQSSIISQILEFIYWTVTIFIFDHMTDENREYVVESCKMNLQAQLLSQNKEKINQNNDKKGLRYLLFLPPLIVLVSCQRKKTMNSQNFATQF